MKKLIYCALALAAGLFAASCQQENLEAVKGGSTVTFTVEVPEAVATKAAVVENGENINNLVYAVYRTTESSEDAFKKLNPELFVYGVNPVAEGKTTVFADNKTTISLELINNQKYVVLFWAQVDQTWIEGAIGESSLTAISYPERLFANDSKYAAFSGVAFVEEVKGSRKESVTLTRPFAQINLATNNPERYDVDVTASSVKIDNAAATFNVATQQASGTRTVEYESATNPDGTFNGYDHYVAMNYIFANPKGENSQTVSVTCVMDTENHGTDIEKIISNVPVAQNYKTNIVGNLLTSDVEYTVELNDNWVDGYIVSPEGNVTQNTFVESASEIQDIIETLNEDADVTSAMITLNEDINLNVATRSETSASPSFTIKSGNTLTIDLNGHTLSGVDKTEASFGLITNQGNLTIVNSAAGKIGKISLEAEHNNGWNRYSSVISTQVGSTLTVGAGVEIEHLGGTDMSYGIDILTNGKGTSAVAVIDGATVKSTYRAIRQFLNGTEANNSLTVKSGSVIESTRGNKSIWMQDPSKSANSGSLVVEAGAKIMTDVYLDVTEGSTEWPVSVSIEASALQGETTVVSENVPAGYKVELVDGVWTVNFYPVAKIGETGYWSLNAAVAAVEDGQTITLVADEMFTENNYFDNGGWKDGLGYSGDKSFTIDLGGFTVSQNGALNDYLMWFKNDGVKANTITLKNGTLDAGKTAYCAIATSSSNAQKLTVNLENINLINNISNGAVIKARGGSELNVKAGTVITGKNSYTGIEAAGNNTVVNVYEGAEIYQNGTSSDVGAIAGASQNATLNIYGGKGKSAKCGIIVMSTGATINVSGGEWTSNGNGTVAGDNQAVLVCQNNRYESSWACKSVLNVTGGTFKGGFNCYGMGPGVEADDAQINIKGGNFNANPANYVVAGYESTENAGTYTVDKPAALKELETALANGGNVTLNKDVTLLESIKVENKVVLDLNGKTITAPLFSAFEVKAGGELTVKNGKVIAYESTVRAIGGKVIIESGEYTSTGTALDSPATYRYSLDCREGGELIINGGTFKSNNGMINVGSTVTINGGKFENIVEKSMTRHFAYVSAPLTINDGEFYGKANGSAGGCFFCGAAAGGDIQVKGGKFTSLWTSGSVNKIFEVYYGGTINVTGGMFNTNGGITSFVTENTDEATKAAYPYVAK